MLRDMFGDVRMLCHDTGLMNPLAKLMWRICRIGGEPSRYRSEPQRQHLVVARLPRDRFFYAARYYPVVLQRRVLCLRLPGELHPSVTG